MNQYLGVGAKADSRGNNNQGLYDYENQAYNSNVTYNLKPAEHSIFE